MGIYIHMGSWEYSNEDDESIHIPRKVTSVSDMPCYDKLIQHVFAIPVHFFVYIQYTQYGKVMNIDNVFLCFCSRERLSEGFV